MKKLLVLLLLLIGFVVWKYQSTHHPDLPGYQTDVSEIQREHEKIYGSPLDSSEIEKGFNDARTNIRRAEYHDAIIFYRVAAKTAALPIFYNNLGTLYMSAGDWPHAFGAFHEALDRDASYRPAIDNLALLKTKSNQEDAQIEYEPNNTPALANDIALNIPVGGEITAGMGDTDVFSIIAPPGPRDLMKVDFENRTRFLEPRLRVLDADGLTFNWDLKAAAGYPISQVISAKPNVLLYLEVSASNGSSGSYRLTVKPLKAFDSHEPNDSIFQPTSLSFGQPMEANIMDAADNDSYSILPTQSGEVTVNLENRSSTLRPGVTLLGTDKSTIAFGPETSMGQSVKMTLKVDGGHLYYIQVWSQNSTAGDYTISVTQ